MFKTPDIISARRILLASTFAAAVMIGGPLLPSAFDAGAPTLGAAFARHGADDGPNDDGHHVGNDDSGHHGGKGGRHGRHHNGEDNHHNNPNHP
jgi:hypothetical protein